MIKTNYIHQIEVYWFIMYLQQVRKYEPKYIISFYCFVFEIGYYSHL